MMNNSPVTALVLGAVFILVGGGTIFGIVGIVALESHHAPKPASDATSSLAFPSQAPVSGTSNPVVGNDAPSESVPVSGDSQPPVTVAAVTTAPSAQPSQTSMAHHWSGGNGGSRMQLFQKLDLTPDQQQQLRNIQATITDRRERRQAIMNILTPDQQAKLQELRAQMRSQNPGWQNSGTQH